MSKTDIVRVRSLADEVRASGRRYRTCLDAFLMSRIDLAERRASHFIVGAMQLSRADLYSRMLKNREPVPEDFCGPLGVSLGSTYSDAAETFLMDMGALPKPTFLQLIG